MALCDACKNEYDKTFQLLYSDGQTYTFDSFECAIHLLAPVCGSCGVRVVGHGLESNGQIFCCDNCAERAGIHELRDRA